MGGDETTREVVTGDQRRPDEDRSVLAGGDAAGQGQGTAGDHRGGKHDVGDRKRDVPGEADAEETRQRHRPRQDDQHGRVATRRMGQGQGEGDQEGAADQQQAGGAGGRTGAAT
ncbi:MAG: hypothetical protein ABW065_08345 [Solirubrobacterales bacterium]